MEGLESGRSGGKPQTGSFPPERWLFISGTLVPSKRKPGSFPPDYAAIPAQAITAVGIGVPDPIVYIPEDEWDYPQLLPGEGVVFYQIDAGTTSDTRVAVVNGSWVEW